MKTNLPQCYVGFVGLLLQEMLVAVFFDPPRPKARSSLKEVLVCGLVQPLCF